MKYCVQHVQDDITARATDTNARAPTGSGSVRQKGHGFLQPLEISVPYGMTQICYQ
jgi:hypothetical protein